MGSAPAGHRAPAHRTYDPQRQGFRTIGAGLRRAALFLGAAAVIAAIVWSPLLLAQSGRYRTAPDATGRAQSRFAAELERRVFYGYHFTSPLTLSQRIAMTEHNVATVFIPSRAADGSLTTGWYWLYLTPPVYVGSLAAMLWLIARRQWRLLLFLCGWLALMVGPLVLLGGEMYSRHALAGVIPLLLALGFVVADLLRLLLSGRLARRWAGAAPWCWPAVYSHGHVMIYIGKSTIGRASPSSRRTAWGM